MTAPPSDPVAPPDAEAAEPPPSAEEAVIEVAFKGNRKEFFRWAKADRVPAVGTAVIVEADRGEDLGHVHSVGERAALRGRGCAHGFGEGRPARRALRTASAGDRQRLAELRQRDETTRREAMERVRHYRLAMKLADAEWRWDRQRLTFWFTSEQRVDFRELVRDLAARFRTRIDLRQIGVRDEAKRLSGIGRCGREYCSAAWLPDLQPVNLGVAKDQSLSLNPTQISGACGRLMCCLRYEHEFYVQQRKRFPKEGRIVPTDRGEEKVVSLDFFRERLTLRGADGEVRVLTLAEFKALPPTGASAPAEGTRPPVGAAEPAAERAPGRAAERAPDQAPRPPRGRDLPVREQRVVPKTVSAAPAEQATEAAGPATEAAGPAGEGAEPATEAAGPTGEGAERRRRRGRRGGRRHRPDGGRPPAGGDAPNGPTDR